MFPLLHGHAPCALVTFGAVKFWRSLVPALQVFLDALIEPSLQTCLPPAQCETPPFLPLHGLFPAYAVPANSSTETNMTTLRALRNFTAHPVRQH